MFSLRDIKLVKVVYDYQIFSLQEYGGVSRYICEVAARTAKADGFNVKVAAFAYINKYLRNYNSDLVVGMPMPVVPKTTKIRSRFNAGIYKHWLQGNSPDIVHETYYSSRRLAPHSSKTVITVHDMVHEKFSSLFRKSDEISLIKAKAILKADHVICVSKNTKRDLLDILNVDPQKVSVIYHGYFLKDSFTPQSTTVGLPQCYILFIGQREGYKNFQRLLQAFASSYKLKSDFSLVCFGGGSFSRKELDLIQRLGLIENRVKQLSGDDNTLVNLYYNASAFVYPSLYEGFGIPLLEAMSFDCPVVCSNTSSIPEVVGNAAELFDPYEPESIVEALETVLYSSERIKKLIMLGRDRIKLFSWDICADQTRLVYLSLM